MPSLREHNRRLEALFCPYARLDVTAIYRRAERIGAMLTTRAANVDGGRHESWPGMHLEQWRRPAVSHVMTWGLKGRDRKTARWPGAGSFPSVVPMREWKRIPPSSIHRPRSRSPIRYSPASAMASIICYDRLMQQHVIGTEPKALRLCRRAIAATSTPEMANAKLPEVCGSRARRRPDAVRSDGLGVTVAP